MTSRKEWFVSGVILNVSVKRKSIHIYVCGNVSTECFYERMKINCVMPKDMFPAYMPCVNKVLNAKGHLIMNHRNMTFAIEHIYS